ncbi:transposase family protein [Geoalkalibacter subterraneus]|jgi:hypothetical protein|uniref:transposase family protein n=1 Tax=Geoalkalibacter subterraneus TaxID=483547 RepID=UPI000693AAAC|nr:transposase family protein [Geoalkalibacter subterraneus]
MGKASRRANREEIKAKARQRKRAQKELGRKQEEEGLKRASHATIANRKSGYKSVEEEGLARNEAAWEQLKVFRGQLPVLLRRLSAIPDPRTAKKTKHKLSVLLMLGILSFVLQMASSREVTREMSRPMLWENLKALFPELEETPHHDTLKRVLSQIEVDQIASVQLELIRKWIRNKKFSRYLVNNCYPVAVDGTQKMARGWLWDEECLQRTFNRGQSAEQTQYYVYVLQANLAFSGGMSIPLMSEFLCHTQGDSHRSKQDCELKAFYRLAARLKEAFPALRIMLLLDGLYANGPVMELCRRNKWQYMIVLKDDALPSTVKEFQALARLEPKNRHFQTWGGRQQRFRWANRIEYSFGANGRKREIVNVVECLESWQEIGNQGCDVVEKTSRHLWLSSEPLDRWNLHERCNLGARSRWGVETGFLVEKHHGYQYEHCFSHDWNAMKGFHYLMQLGHMFNIMARYSEKIARIIRETGVRGLIRLVRETIASPWLNQAWIREQIAAPFQLRLT